MGTMYIDQKINFADEEVCETILIQKNRSENGLM